MAERKIKPSDYLLYIDPNGGTSYSNVVCLESFDLSASVGTTEASTMCGPDSAPGDITASISGTGQTLLDPDTGKISAPDLFDLLQDKSDFSWKIQRAGGNSVAGDFSKSGDGYFSQYSENYTKDANGKFGFTIAVKGEMTQVIASGS